jgi:ribose-phosphate pyrophosphokinase
VIAGATHAILCGPAIQIMQTSPVTELIVTNTIYVPPHKQLDKIKVLSVAPLMAQAIRNIHTGESVGALFR